MNFIERVMRVMTHINIGASLGLAAWVLWSGWLVVTGQITPATRVAEVDALTSLARPAQAGEPARMHLVAVQAGAGTLAPCHEATRAPQRASLDLSGADL